ncbi:MAG: amino acid permease [Candidatus Thermoplasmatota archaeon]
MESPSTPAPPPSPAAAEPEGEVKLAREITMLDATMMGVGALMGGGVFVLMGLAADVAGPAVLLALFLNGLITIPTLLVYAELGSASNDAGGGYLWVKQGMGQPWGFLGGWFSWFSHVIACSLYSIAAAAFIFTLAHYAGWLEHESLFMLKALALSLCALFVGLNYVGVKVGIKAENVVNSFVLLVVLVFIGFGLWRVAQVPDLVNSNLFPFFGNSGTLGGLSNTFLAMGITFIAFEGYEIISQTSEEIQNPRRNIPRAIWASFLIVWVIMLLIAFIALGATQAPDGGPSWLYLGLLKERALATAAAQIMPYGTVVIAGAALLLQLTALNATIYSSSRVSFAMGRDGNLPRVFGKVHPKRRTPHTAVLGSGILALAVALLPIEAVAASADVMFLLLFLLVNLAYIKLRKTIPADRFGFRAPLFPYIPIVGIITKFFLAVYLFKYSPLAWYVTLVWLAVGLAAYYLYVRRREGAGEPTPLPLIPLPVVRADRRSYRILVLLLSPAPSMARALSRTAGAVAQSLDGEVVFLQPILVPEVTPLSEGVAMSRDRTLLAEARSALPAGVPGTTMVRIGHSLEELVRDAVQEEGASLLLMSGQSRATVGQPTSGLLAYPPCDLAMLRLRTPDVAGGRVLVTAGTQAALGIRLGSAIAKAAGGQTRILHILTESDTEGERARTQAVVAQSAVLGANSETQFASGDPVKILLEASRNQDLVVVGASLAPRPWRRSLLGPRTQEIADRASGNVLLVRVAAERSNSHWLGRRLLTVQRYFQPE